MGRKPNPSDTPERSGSAAGMEENMKKAVAEMLVLFLLHERDMYIGEIPEELERRSGGTFHIVFPYSIIYRMVKFEYIEEQKKRIAPDGRKRQYYAITEKGTAYLQELRDTFGQFFEGVTTILASEGEVYEQTESAGAAVYEAGEQEADMQPEAEAQAEKRPEADDWNVSGRLSGCLV